MINSVVLVGRLVADPELRYTQSGTAVASMRIAVDRKFRNAAGEREADFINLTAWRKTAELAGQYLQKGRMVGVQGRLQSRNYQDRDGNNRVGYDVVVDDLQFLDSGNRGGGSGGPGPQGPPQQQRPPAQQQDFPGSAASQIPEEPPFADDPHGDDDLPF